MKGITLRPLIVLLALLLAACTTPPVRVYNIKTYGGPVQPPDQVALLVAATGTKIVSIDGAGFRPPKGRYGEYRLAFLPGSYRLEVAGTEGISSVIPVEFQAVAGRRYRVRTYSQKVLQDTPWGGTWDLHAIVDDHTERPMWWCQQGSRCREMQIREEISVDLPPGAPGPSP